MEQSGSPAFLRMGTTATVLLIGHNPGLDELVHALTAEGEPTALRRLESGLKTGSLATLTIAGEWSDLAPGTARLQSLVRPRDLE